MTVTKGLQTNWKPVTVQGCLLWLDQKILGVYDMSNLSEIEQAVRQLSSEDLSAFRAWFTEFDAELWDRQFEADEAAGQLDALAEKALQHLREGRCTDL